MQNNEVNTKIQNNLVFNNAATNTCLTSLKPCQKAGGSQPKVHRHFGTISFAWHLIFSFMSLRPHPWCCHGCWWSMMASSTLIVIQSKPLLRTTTGGDTLNTSSAQNPPRPCTHSHHRMCIEAHRCRRCGITCWRLCFCLLVDSFFYIT